MALRLKNHGRRVWQSKSHCIQEAQNRERAIEKWARNQGQSSRMCPFDTTMYTRTVLGVFQTSQFDNSDQQSVLIVKEQFSSGLGRMEEAVCELGS